MIEKKGKIVNLEEEYQDVLQNIEFAIVSVYHKHPEMLDYDVETTLTALIRTYQAEQRQQQKKAPSLTELRQELYDSIESMCEWRLGRGELTAAHEAGGLPSVSAITLEEMIQCLKRIQKSVKRWTKQGGRQGYLTFVQQYVL